MNNKRIELDGLKKYVAIVQRNGSRQKTEYVDWFRNDNAASDGYRQIMHDIGYKVLNVEIGFPCVVTIE